MKKCKSYTNDPKNIDAFGGVYMRTLSAAIVGGLPLKKCHELAQSVVDCIDELDDTNSVPCLTACGQWDEDLGGIVYYSHSGNKYLVRQTHKPNECPKIEIEYPAESCLADVFAKI